MNRMTATQILVAALLFSASTGLPQVSRGRRSGLIMGGGGLGMGEETSAMRESASAPVTIRARELSRSQAAAYFDDQISSMYAKTGTNAIVQTHRWRYDGAGQWSREPAGGAVIRVRQHIGGCRYLAELLRWHAWEQDYVAAETEPFAVDLYIATADKTGFRPMTGKDGTKSLLPDGQRLVLPRLERAADTYSYESVMGAKRTVILMKGWMETLPLTYEDFARAVADGTTFDVLSVKQVKCHACNGRGTREKTYEERGRIGTPLCGTCRGKRVIQSRILHRITR